MQLPLLIYCQQSMVRQGKAFFGVYETALELLVL